MKKHQKSNDYLEKDLNITRMSIFLQYSPVKRYFDFKILYDVTERITVLKLKFNENDP